jgi:hypothetical protein
MLHLIEKIVAVNSDFSVDCVFNTGETRRVKLHDWVERFREANDGWASKIADYSYFKTVHLDSYGTLTWDNQLNFCPDTLYSISEPFAIEA